MLFNSLLICIHTFYLLSLVTVSYLINIHSLTSQSLHTHQSIEKFKKLHIQSLTSLSSTITTTDNIIGGLDAKIVYSLGTTITYDL